MSGTDVREIVAYTAVYGGVDHLMTAPRIPGVRFVCFTDKPSFARKGWEVRVVPPSHPTPRRAAKLFKIVPHRFFPDHEWSVWMDGSHVLRRHPAGLIGQVRSGLGAFAHPQRRSVYDEAEACIALGFDEAVITDQMACYRALGYRGEEGLNQCSVLVRRHRDPAVMDAMENWWREIESGSVRDQLSFNFVAWRNGLEVSTLSGHVYWNDWFYYTPHGKRPSRIASLIEAHRMSDERHWRVLLSAKDRLGRIVGLVQGGG